MELRAKSLAQPFITTEDSLYGLNLFLTKGDHGVVYVLTLERVSELLASVWQGFPIFYGVSQVKTFLSGFTFFRGVCKLLLEWARY